MTKCNYGNCNRNSKYALYELFIVDDKKFLKRWLDVCPLHEDLIALNSASLRREYPDAKWEAID